MIAEQLATRAGAAIEKAQLHQAVENELAERRRAEGALRRHEAEQAMILDTVRAMIWYKDADNRVLRCNRAAAKYAGRTVSEIEGRLVSDFMPPARARAYHLNDLAVIASGKPKIGELEEVKLRGGARCWMQRDTLPHRDESGAIVGVVIIAVDVTKRKRAEDLAVARGGRSASSWRTSHTSSARPSPRSRASRRRSARAPGATRPTVRGS